MRDPYKVLGVDRKASAADIKGAYRRLAKKLHPDANKNDPKAATRFAELNAANEILADEQKRKAFDRGEIDAEGKPKFQGFEGFGAGAQPGGSNSQFESFHFGPEGFTRSTRGGRAGAGGAGGGFGNFEDILREAFGGAGGGGAGQRGARFEAEDFGPVPGADVRAEATVTLPEAAKGVTRRLRLPIGKDIDVKIPAGITSGQHVRVRGQGMPGQGGAPGDVLITVTVAPHPLFTLDGADLKLDLPITLYEAALGGKVRVPTLDGHVEVTIPPWTSSGRTFRLRGKGFPATSGKGALLATVRIVLPEKTDPDLDELMRKWRSDKPYDPRKDM
jgi:DnaJ-class molecular chaperone